MFQEKKEDKTVVYVKITKLLNKVISLLNIIQYPGMDPEGGPGGFEATQNVQ